MTFDRDEFCGADVHGARPQRGAPPPRSPSAAIRWAQEQARLQQQTRRTFLSKGIGAMYLATLAGAGVGRACAEASASPMPRPHRPPRARRVIYLHMAGSPSQLELFDYKPELAKWDGQDCPDRYLQGKRFAFIVGTPKMLGPQYPFAQHGESGAWVSDRLPHFAKVVDKVSIIKSMHTSEFNHAPAQLLLHSGSPRIGRPSLGSWTLYGLGSESEDLPGFVVLVSGGKVPSAGKSVWGAGFLPSVYQGVQCRAKGDPVLYASNPDGLPRSTRRRALDTLRELNEHRHQDTEDPEILTRISQYELAFRMQTSVPDAMDLSREPRHIHELYGTEPGKESFANNCLLARRLAERGVRFIQLYHWGWDSHGAGKEEALNLGFKDRCREADRPMSALLLDLEQRGMLDDTLVVWGGEFGRTSMRENRGGTEMAHVGRDHNPQAFTMWMAGGGIRPGYTHGATDDIGYEVVDQPVHVHDLQATILDRLGYDHDRLTYPFQGRQYRLTDVSGRVVPELLA